MPDRHMVGTTLLADSEGHTWTLGEALDTLRRRIARRQPAVQLEPSQRIVCRVANDYNLGLPTIWLDALVEDRPTPASPEPPC